MNKNKVNKHYVGEQLFSPRTKARVGDYGVHGCTPVLIVKAKSNEDYLSVSDLAEILYKCPVIEIILADGRRIT